MDEAPHEYRFIIDGLSPDRLPMARLAQYMADLARLLGEVESVHFSRIESGSVQTVQTVEPAARPFVRDRLKAVLSAEAPEDAAKAFKALNGRLAADNATGSLQDGAGLEILSFPGREGLTHPQTLAYTAVHESGSLDGVLIRIGGRGDSVAVHVQDGAVTHRCTADREIARRLAQHLFGDRIQLQGDGLWERHSNGSWSLKRFEIANFRTLDNASLREVVSRLRKIEGSEWKDIADPVAELQRIRHL